MDDESVSFYCYLHRISCCRCSSRSVATLLETLPEGRPPHNKFTFCTILFSRSPVVDETVRFLEFQIHLLALAVMFVTICISKQSLQK